GGWELAAVAPLALWRAAPKLAGIDCERRRGAGNFRCINRSTRRDLSQSVSAVSACSALIVIMLDRKRLHRERARAVRIHRHRSTDAILAHERAQTREQGRELLGCGMGTREQRVLQHTTWCGIDGDRH